jgi:PAS domain S-box-containing protein
MKPDRHELLRFYLSQASELMLEWVLPVLPIEPDMFSSMELVDEILQTVVNVVKRGDRAQLRTLDAFPAALYVTDIDGVIIYFNPACIDFAGRRPVIGKDRWCVTWKLHSNDGEFLPHDQCPMAVAIRTRRPVRGVTAVAERPDGTRVNFLPFPTPVIDDHGELLAAVNILIDITGSHQDLLQELHGDLQIWQNVLVEQALAAFSVDELKRLVIEMELESGQSPPSTLH